MTDYPFPSDFIRKVRKHYPDQADLMLSSFKKKDTIAIRVNTLKATKAQIETLLSNAHLSFVPVSWCIEAYLVQTTDTKVLTSFPEYEQGLFYIQGLSSMVPTIVLQPQPEEYILDITAAPGSKTSHMAAHMLNQGKIVANDTSRTRLYKLEANIERLGVTNVTISNHPGERLWEKYHNIFDKVLLDAPCSMEGMFEADDPKSYEHWSQKKVKRLAKQQRWCFALHFLVSSQGGLWCTPPARCLQKKMKGCWNG